MAVEVLLKNISNEKKPNNLIFIFYRMPYHCPRENSTATLW